MRAGNVVIGRGEDANSVHVIDFGLAKEADMDDDEEDVDPSWRDALQGLVGHQSWPWLSRDMS